MPFLHRIIEKQVLSASRAFPSLLLTGPRRSGKTTLFRRLFPRAQYRLLEDLDERERVRQDPRGYLASLRPPVILDEIQNAPELFNYIRTLIDTGPSRKGRWLLTGSQEAPLMRGVSESMAGRVAIFRLLPFSAEESAKVSVFGGGFPEPLAKPGQARRWFSSYLQTYIERDVRQAGGIKDLGLFRRFMGLLAVRSGQPLNRSELAAPLGVAISTVSEWVSVLEMTSQILLVTPFYENLGKRLVKAPKIYFMDTGLLCHLLGVESRAQLERSPMVGPVFESLVAGELAKALINRGREPRLHFFRDQQGLEVDFVIPSGPRRLTLVEAKAGKTPLPRMADALRKVRDAAKRYACELIVAHSGSKMNFSGLGDGAKAMPWKDLAGLFDSRR